MLILALIGLVTIAIAGKGLWESCKFFGRTIVPRPQKLNKRRIALAYALIIASGLAVLGGLSEIALSVYTLAA